MGRRAQFPRNGVLLVGGAGRGGLATGTPLPPCCRKSPKVAGVLPLLYPHDLSTGDFVLTLESFLGSTAVLSSATFTRLSKQWTDDYHAFCERDLSSVDYVYVWADGIHVDVRLEKDKLCLLRSSGYAGPGLCGRRQRAWLLACAAGGLPRFPGAARLGAQDGQRPGRVAQVRSSGREGRPG